MESMEFKHSGFEAERTVAMLTILDNSVLAEIDLPLGWFGNEHIRAVLETASSLNSQGVPAEPTTIAERLSDSRPGVDWMSYIVDLCRNVIGHRNSLNSYVDVIRSEYQRRQSQTIAQRLIADVADEGQNAVDLAIRELMDLNMRNRSYDYDAKAVVKAGIEYTEKAFEAAQNGGQIGITTGLSDLDKATGGFHGSDLVVIPARPAMGKTALMLNLALNSNARFGVISSEQGVEQMGTRMISIQGQVSGARIRNGSLTDEDWRSFEVGARTLLNNAKFHLNDDPVITIGEIQRQARKWKFTHDIQILFVDYIQRIQPTDSRLAKHAQVEEVTRGLKNLARELNIPVVALAQVNRECEKRPDKRPGMGDIADASIVEKEADSIWTLYRDEVYNSDTHDQGVAEINICKNRHGPTGAVRVVWDGKCFKFRDIYRGEV
ncbi:replicative DNA helicase [Pontibacterium sp.]|uniref:replicative DNA helicase n=1 Tax=Pontibacterium sp. TaxID=2036026 RepID=UPI003562C7CE